MKRGTRLYLETTEVPVSRTIVEITKLLVAAGARQIAQEYGDDGAITGMRFVLTHENTQLCFQLPVRTATIYGALVERRHAMGNVGKRREQAERIAWRQMYRWIQAQLAMIDCGMVRAREVFLPYLQVPDGRTVFELMEASRFKALPAGKPE